MIYGDSEPEAWCLLLETPRGCLRDYRAARVKEASVMKTPCSGRSASRDRSGRGCAMLAHVRGARNRPKAESAYAMRAFSTGSEIRITPLLHYQFHLPAAAWYFLIMS